MKKSVLGFIPIVAALSACSSPQQSTVPLDMQTVLAYQQRVASPQNNNPSEYWDLNKQEAEPKVLIIEHRSARNTPPYYDRYRHYGIYDY